MARPPRIDVPGLPQHLVARGHNKSDCFWSEVDRAVYLKYLREEGCASECDLHAYVLMTNHVHLLVTGRKERSISRLMQHVGRRYCRYVNRAYRRSGPLYESRFKSSLIESEAYFLACMRYIDLNPVRADIVGHPSHYPWSSYRENATGRPDGLLVPHHEYLRLARDDRERGSAYAALVEQPLESRWLDEIRQASKRNGVLGGPQFLQALEEGLGRPVTTSDPGRPTTRPKKLKK